MFLGMLIVRGGRAAAERIRQDGSNSGTAETYDGGRGAGQGEGAWNLPGQDEEGGTYSYDPESRRVHGLFRMVEWSVRRDGLLL